MYWDYKQYQATNNLVFMLGVTKLVKNDTKLNFFPNFFEG